MFTHGIRCKPGVLECLGESPVSACFLSQSTGLKNEAGVFCSLEFGPQFFSFILLDLVQMPLALRC